MAATTSEETRPREAGGTAPPSPAGPLPADASPAVRMPPTLGLPTALQTIRFGLRPMGFNFRARKELGQTFSVKLLSREEQIVVTDHPDHVRSLFTAKMHEQHSLTGESPLRPVLGPDSVLTSIGKRHLRQRKLLLPPFHGDAVKHYAQMISDIAEREIDRWEVGRPFSLAPRMQAVTLDVIMSGIFGIDGRPEPGSVEDELRRSVRRLVGYSTKPWWMLVELHNIGRDEPRGVLKRVMREANARFDAVIRARRASDRRGDDVLSLLLDARTEDGEPLTDEELRAELLSLVLAGHETTANQLAWTFERLLRFPQAYERLREEVRAGGEAAQEQVEATVHEGMRVRPVIPMVARLVNVPWQLGEYVVPAGTPVALGILLLHHREDLYPDPHVFRPERFLGRRPGTYTWIPFGGGTRRCLGAALAMAEQRVVLEAIARRTDMVAPDLRPERARQRNVTMIPQLGGRVVVTAKR